jgi:putative flavoprotein involved in K+ transport
MIHVNTVVIGAGHAGIAMSYWLTKLGVEHQVLERGKLGQRWRSERWDSLTLLTPNWATQLPGFEYSGSDPDGFDSRDEYISYLEKYAAHFGAPIQDDTEVESLERAETNGGYLLRTSKGDVETSNVIIATGPFHDPHIPSSSGRISSSVVQRHTSQYRSPGQLPDGSVLVIGGGNSGFQIAEELLRAGRRVFLSVGRLRGAPRRYRGKDIIWWFVKLGVLDRTVEDLPSPDTQNVPPPLLSGVSGGHELNPRRFAEGGGVFLGRFIDAQGQSLEFSPDVNESLSKACEAYSGFMDAIDHYIEAQGLDAPWEDREQALAQFTPAEIKEPITTLDVEHDNIRSIVWATGFDSSYRWVKLPVFDGSGRPEHSGGATACEGVYFLGLRWLRKYKSFFIYGVGEDAELIARKIAARG